MSRISAFSSLTTMFPTKNLICQYVNLTDELNIDLEYDIHTGLLNILVKNTGNHRQYPSQINVLSNPNMNDQSALEYSSNINDQITDFVSFGENVQPKICIELSNIYVYDLDDENEIDLTSPEVFLFSSSSSSSCFDDQTTDNDDGYSTHSLDDIDQHDARTIPSSKLIQPFVSYQSHFSEDYLSSIARLIDRMMWFNPFRKIVKQMINCSLTQL